MSALTISGMFADLVKSVGRKTAAVAAVVACMATSPATAGPETAKATFASRLQAARTLLRVGAEGLGGAGAPIIADAIARSRYVLIGEDHLSREIPLFTTQVCRMMAPSGLDAFAVEIGPEAARVVNDQLRRPDRAERIASFMRSHPDAFAFQNGRDESDLVAACARLAGPRFRVWGLDQEFFGAAGHLFERMLSERPGPVAKAAIGRLASIDRAATAKALASGTPADLFIFSATDAQLAQADAAIARDGGAHVRALFDALLETRAIFLGQQTDGFRSNRRRGLLMKRLLTSHLAEAPGRARVLFKFGDVHMAKGVNALGQRDLGNFVAERADGEGASSLHIAVYGAKGVHALYGGVGRPARHERFVLTDDPSYAWLKGALAASGSKSTGDDWMLIDLRSLRDRLPDDTPAGWRNVAQRYDLLVVAPELTPSTLLGTR